MDVYEQRKSYAKGTPENAMLKLALNSVYGDSNNQYSVFYDPMYTMKITVNGQLSLLMLAERLLKFEELKLVQLNTDGLTVALPRDKEDEYSAVCKKWESDVGLELEFVEYERMMIRDKLLLSNLQERWYKAQGQVRRSWLAPESVFVGHSDGC